MIPERAVFVHYPKSGGTSVSQQLEVALGDDALIYVDPDIFTTKGKDHSPFPENKRLVTGHFKASRYELSDAYIFTILRHPVDVLISWYFYWLSSSNVGRVNLNHRLDSFLNSNLSILNFARTDNYSKMMSDVYFGDIDLERLDFVGFHENIDNDVAKLSSHLGVALRNDVYLNKTKDSPERDGVEANGKIIAKLRDILKDDIEFFEKMQNRYS